MQETFNKLIRHQFPMHSFFSCDALSHSLQDSNASLKVKTTKAKGVELHFLTHNTLGLRRACWSSSMRTKTNDKRVNHSLSHGLTQTKQQVDQCIVKAFLCAPMNHGHIQTHKTHHGLDLGQAITFPPNRIFVSSHETCTQMSFCLWTPKLGISKFSKLRLL